MPQSHRPSPAPKPSRSAATPLDSTRAAARGAGTHEATEFFTDGIRTAATLWLPHADAFRCPAVVTGPGFGGVKEMLIPTYAQALAARGIACLAFDPVGFGESGGRRRQHIDPHQQVRSFTAALDALERDPRIDPTRLGAFGTSLSGAHALRCAARDPRVRSAVVIVPFIRLPRAQSPRLAARVALELLRRAARRPDRRIAVAGAPGEVAAMTSDGALDWLHAIAAEAPNFRNEVTVMSLLSMATYSAMRAAGRVTVPTLAIVAERDSITPGALVRSAMRTAPRAEIVGFPETHFELFTADLQASVDATTTWFAEHLADRGLARAAADH